MALTESIIILSGITSLNCVCVHIYALFVILDKYKTEWFCILILNIFCVIYAFLPQDTLKCIKGLKMIIIDYIDDFMNNIILQCAKYISKNYMHNVMFKILKIFTFKLETKAWFSIL